MLDTLTVHDRKAAAVFVHRRQRSIILALVGAERSLSELARQTDMPLNLLHHHLGKFLRLGLVTITREARRAGSPIRYYRAVARAFFVPAEAMGSLPGVELNEHLSSVLERTLSATLKGLTYSHDGDHPIMKLVKDAEPRRTAAELWLDLRLSAQDGAALAADLQTLVQSFASRSTPDGRRHIVHAAIAAV